MVFSINTPLDHPPAVPPHLPRVVDCSYFPPQASEASTRCFPLVDREGSGCLRPPGAAVASKKSLDDSRHLIASAM